MQSWSLIDNFSQIIFIIFINNEMSFFFLELNLFILDMHFIKVLLYIVHCKISSRIFLSTMYDKYSVIYYSRAFFGIKNPQRLLQRQVKGSHSHKSSSELGCDSQFPGFLYHTLTQKGHTHTSLFLLKMA